MPKYVDIEPLIKHYIALENIDWNQKVAPPSWSYAYKSFIDYILELPTADVVPKSEEGAECPTCHGTGRIGTTDWLTKGLSKKQLAEKKAKAIAEHEQHIKQDVAREIFEDLEKFVEKCVNTDWYWYEDMVRDICNLEKKYKKYLIGRSDDLSRSAGCTRKK